MSYPNGLHVVTSPAEAAGSPSVILVHGGLDRAESFRRVMRRLPDMGVVAYDRRGYEGSRAGGVVDLGGHIADLLDVVTEVRSQGTASVSAVGHSLGGDVVIGAALAEPRALNSIGAFEPPMPWLGFRRQPDGGEQAPRTWAPMAEDPGLEAERFFGRMVSPSTWDRMPEEGREARRADGPALVADLLSIRGETPFDVMDLSVPVVFGMGALGLPHHQEGVAWLGAHVPGAESYVIDGAHHGAHLSHPDRFAAFVRLVVERARR
jgi:pimeloyl-ACP methyl ester carboxylesterase